jgi:Fur family transcriptional regulator, ferric uptake regulator
LKSLQVEAALSALLKSTGLRETPQRRAIARLFFAVQSPVSATEMFELARLGQPKTEFATVYRTLQTFLRQGLATGANFADGSFRYEPSQDSRGSVHLVCRCCGRTFRVDEPALAQVRESVASHHSVEFSRAHHEVWVRCKSGPCSDPSGAKVE